MSYTIQRTTHGDFWWIVWDNYKGNRSQGVAKSYGEALDKVGSNFLYWFDRDPMCMNEREVDFYRKRYHDRLH